MRPAASLIPYKNDSMAPVVKTRGQLIPLLGWIAKNYQHRQERSGHQEDFIFCRRAAPRLPCLCARTTRGLQLGWVLLAFLGDQPIDELDELVFAAGRFNLQPIFAVDDDGRCAVDFVGLKQTLGRTHLDVHRE